MTTQQALEMLEELGLKIAVRNGVPVLLGDKRLVTPNLRTALRWHKKKILKSLGHHPTQGEIQTASPTGRTWLWRYGHTYTETPEDTWQWNHPERHPAGAWWVRLPGEKRWRPIPGRCDSTPEELGLVEMHA